jgi:hypothetical protein
VLSVVAIGIPPFCGWLSRPAPNASLLEGGVVSVDGAMGIPTQVLEGPLAPEGIHWLELDRALVLGNRGGLLAIDLGEPAEARALLVQAMAGNRFEVEGSLDGELAADLDGCRGPERARHAHPIQTLDPPQSFRHLRIRNPDVLGVSALGAVRAYAEVPDGWPLVGPPRPAPISAFPWLELATVTRAKALVAVAGALLLAASWWLDRERARPGRLARAVTALLAVTAGVSALGWWNFLQISRGDYERSFYNYWDAHHYYLGAKYCAPEIGYTKLYECILAADLLSGLGE